MDSSSNKGKVVVIIGLVLFIVAAVFAVRQHFYLSDLNDNLAQAQTKLEKTTSEVANLQQKNTELNEQVNGTGNLEWRNAQGRVSMLGLIGSGKVCYLTFDDGPYPANTSAILEILKQKDAVATWFVLANDEEYTYLDLDLCKTIEEQGSVVGLHDWDQNSSYSYYKGSVDNYFTSDFNKVKEKIEGIVGHEIDIMRFAGGSATIAYYNESIGKALPQAMIEKGYQYFDWNVCAMDSDPSYFVGSSTPASTIVEQVVEQAEYYAQRNAPICVLMHDNPGKETTVEALPTIIDKLRAMGYSFAVLTNDSPGFYQVAVK